MRPRPVDVNGGDGATSSSSSLLDTLSALVEAHLLQVVEAPAPADAGSAWTKPVRKRPRGRVGRLRAGEEAEERRLEPEVTFRQLETVRAFALERLEVSGEAADHLPAACWLLPFGGRGGHQSAFWS